MISFEESAEQLNNMTYKDYYDRLSMIALSLFEWENLPNNISEKYLEEILYKRGQILFFDDEDLGLMVCECSPSGEMNHYNEPLTYTTHAINFSKNIKRKDSVLIRDNIMEKVVERTVALFSMRLTTAERTIDTNINAQRFPLLIKGTDKQQTSLKILYKKIVDNIPIIFGDKDLNSDTLKVLKTDSPYVVDKVQSYKHQLYNEALTFLGIDNANTDKKERLITDEVESNNHNISMSIEMRLATRQKACKLINEKYGTNISVKCRDFKGEEGEDIE